MTAALRDLFDGLAAAKPQILFIDDWQGRRRDAPVVGAIRSIDKRAVWCADGDQGFAGGDVNMNDA